MSNQWISVKDQTPKNRQRVIINYEHGVTIADYMVFSNGNSTWWAITELGTCNDRTNAEYVTHWMHLPEPPKTN